MHQYNVGATFERIAIDVAGPFPRSDRGNRYLLVTIEDVTKWLEEASTATDALVINILPPRNTPGII
jgi:hypothetical protein